MYADRLILPQICQQGSKIVAYQQKGTNKEEVSGRRRPPGNKIADESILDLEYLEMLNTIENDTETKYLPDDSEIQQV